MHEGHLTRELLLAAVYPEGPAPDLTPTIIAHLEAICPTCRAELVAWNQELAESGVVTGRFPGGRERTRRGELAEEVAKLPPEEQETLADHLETAPERLDALAQAEALLEASRGCLPAEPGEALAQAREAQQLLRGELSTPAAVALYARAVAYEANSLRAQGDLPGAADLFAAARFLLRSHSLGEQFINAELDRLEGSLLRDQRRLPAAVETLHRAWVAYLLGGERVEAARCGLKLGLVHREQGEYDEAISITRQALGLILEADEEPRLLFMAFHNLACFHTDASRYSEARHLLEETRELAAAFPDPWSRNLRHWVEGNVARGLEEDDAAEEAYRAARDGFLAEGVGYDAALVSLDLALLYARQGRTADVKRLATEMLPVFEAQDVHREAFAALLLFQEAARTEQVTVAFLQELTTYLQAARTDPELTFHASR